MSLVASLDLPSGHEGHSLLVRCRLRDADGAFAESAAHAVFTYAGPEANRSQPRNRYVEHEVASAYAAWARQRAAELGREGKVQEGRTVLLDTVAPIRQIAGHDPELLLIASALEAEAAKLERMDNLDLKRLQYSSYGALSSKGEDGMTIGTMAFVAGETLNVTARPLSREAARAPFYVVAITPDPDATRLAEAAGRALVARNSSAFGFTVVDSGTRVFDPGAGETLSREDERKLALALTAAEDGVKMAFVRAALEGGLSSHWYAAEKAAVVSLAGGAGSELPLEAFLAYEMAVYGSRNRWPAWDPTAARRCDVKGCWGNLGEAREQIEEKITGGDLCPGCRSLYEAAGVDLEPLLRLVSAVRELAPAHPAGVPG